MDQIIIENLKVFAHHGVFETETKKGQNFYINAILYCNIQKPGMSDELVDATDYGKVCEFMADYMQKYTYKLIEAVAQNMANEVLIQFPGVKEIELEIRKPEAPVALEFESISVKIRRGWHDVYLSYGANIGDKEANIIEALEKLSNRRDCQMIKQSKLLVTEPYGYEKQDDFLNGACHIKTLLGQEELLCVLHEIEKEAKRERTIHWGPRTLDIDILFYDKKIYESDQLIIPHIDLENRWFVLKPMDEIAPNFRHPILNKTIHQMLMEVT